MGFDPATIALATLAVSAAGVGVSTYSAYRQAEAQNDAAEYNERVAKRNNEIAEIQALDAERRGKIEEKQHRLRVSRLLGAQRAAAAGSGVVVDTGSPLAMLEDTAMLGEYDAETIKHNAKREAWALRAGKQGTSYGRTSPVLAAGGTLLGGASRLGAQYVQFNEMGLLGSQKVKGG